MSDVRIENLPSENPGQVARTQVGNVVVSTIERSAELQAMDQAIGLMQGIVGDEERMNLDTPGLYETMAFSCDDEGRVTSWTDLTARRYDTLVDAEAGHAEVVNIYAEEQP